MRTATRRARAGFTVIEIIVTVMIMGMMLAGIAQLLTTVRSARDQVHNIQETQLAGPAILDLIERDLRSIITAQIPRELHLKVANNVVLGEDADRLDFIATTDGLLWTSEGSRHMRADVNEVGYCLRRNPDDDDFLEIYRREGYGVDEDPHEGGRYIFLHDHVVSFNIEVFIEDGPDAEPIEEWGVDPSDPETQGLPTSLRITLQLELEPRLLREQLAHLRMKQKRTYERIIRLPESLRVAEGDIPRLGPPTGGGGDQGEGPPEDDTEGSGDTLGDSGTGTGAGQGSGSGSGDGDRTTIDGERRDG